MTYSKQTVVVCGVLGLILVSAATGTYLFVKHTNEAVTEETREIFQDGTTGAGYTDLQGNTVSLEQFLGQVLVVTSWASWSPYSSADLQALNTLAAAYQDKSVVFLAINRKEVLTQAQRYAATLTELPHITLVIDTEDRFYTLVGGYAMPETVVFDQRGVITEHMRGVFVANTIEASINSLLATN